MASLYKRANSPYLWIKFSDNEKQLLNLSANGISTRKKSRRQAEFVLKDYQDRLLKSSYGKASELTGDILFSEVLDKYIQMKSAEGNPLDSKTITIYNKAIKKFFEVLDDKLVKEYTRKDYRNYINYLTTRNLAQNTKAMFTSRIVALFNWLIKEEYITKHKFEAIHEEKKAVKYLSQSQIKELLEYASTTKFYYLVKFMLLSAFRAHEALKLNKADISKGKIFVLGKGNKKAHIPITSAMAKLLPNLPETNVAGYYFADFTYNGLREFCNRASVKLGFKITSHDMRRYRLSRMANNGTHLYFVMEYARHSSLELTKKYLKTDYADMLTNIEKFTEDDLD